MGLAGHKWSPSCLSNSSVQRLRGPMPGASGREGTPSWGRGGVCTPLWLEEGGEGGEGRRGDLLGRERVGVEGRLEGPLRARARDDAGRHFLLL